MNDKTPMVGLFGSFGSLSLGQLNEWVGLACGCLTIIYLITKLVILARKGLRKK